MSVCRWVKAGALRRMPRASGAGVEGVLGRKVGGEQREVVRGLL